MNGNSSRTEKAENSELKIRWKEKQKNDSTCPRQIKFYLNKSNVEKLEGAVGPT